MTTPTRRIRRAQSSIASGLAALELRDARARLRSKDIVISAIAQSAVDTEAWADALRMERDAAHEECARLTAAHEDRARLAASVAGFRTTSAEITAARLVQVICEDADRIATLTAERDHARAIAVALEQEEALVRRHSVNVSDVATFLEDAWDDGNCTGLDGWEGPGRGGADPDWEAINARRRCVDRTLLRLSDALHAQALARVPMDSDRTSEVEG